MKNLLFTLVLLFTFTVYSQRNVSNPVSDSFVLLGADYAGPSNQIQVPDGKFWTLAGVSDSWRFTTPEHYASTGSALWYFDSLNSNQDQFLFFPAGSLLYADSDPGSYSFLIILEHNYDTNSSLSSTNVELPNQIRLFPNPTTSEVALNSDKQYDIEVYDILGNKVMELTGNTIDMEHLSSATYIVNALDTETNERLSYKVIKN